MIAPRWTDPWDEDDSDGPFHGEPGFRSESIRTSDVPDLLDIMYGGRFPATHAPGNLTVDQYIEILTNGSCGD